MLAPYGQVRIEDDRAPHDTFRYDRVHKMVNDAFRVQCGMKLEQYFD